MTTERQILLPRLVLPQLQRRFGVSRVAINDAMRFKTNSVLAQSIREVAIKEYGLSVYYPPKTITQ